MEKRLSRWGVGPRIALAAGAALILAGLGTWLWPRIFILAAVPYAALATVGAILVAIGVPLWLWGVAAAMSAYNSDALVTSGPFALVRHPIYSAWIVLILPGVALLSRSWLLLAAALAGYAAFKLSIRREDEYLEERFGQAYRDYRSRVSEIIPLPSLKR